MFDIAPTEFLLVAFVALVVIGPKDLPRAMRLLGTWVGRARAVGRQFRSGFDEMVREAELAEMEKKWKAENERIMREHPAPASSPDAGDAPPAPDAAPSHEADGADRPVMVERPHVAPAEPAPPSGDDRPVMVEHPHVVAAEPGAATPPADKAPS